jgi:hypothetical protein
MKINPNILRKTKAYLIGHMEYGDGTKWRKEFQEKIAEIGVTCFNPYEKPYENDILGVDESDSIRDECRRKIADGKYDDVAKLFKAVRNLDLALCDKSDFIVCYLNPKIPTFGTMEELSTSVRMKKPIFMVMEGGKDKTPLWILGMFPHEFIFESIDELVKELNLYDSGEKKVDNKYWRLLKKEYR